VASAASSAFPDQTQILIAEFALVATPLERRGSVRDARPHGIGGPLEPERSSPRGGA